MKLAVHCALLAALGAFGATLPPLALGLSAAPAKSAKPTPTEKKCAAAARKLEREQRHAKGVDERIAAHERALRTCATKSQCARFEANLKAQQRLRVRHDERLQRFAAARDAACPKKG